MKIKKITIILTVAFTVIMTTLTFTARDINNYYFLPNVKVTRLTNEQYDVYITLNDGAEIITTKSGLAISKELFDGKSEFYIIESRTKNGENRTYVKQIFITVNGENETSYFIESGITRSDFLVTESSKILSSGDEVYIVK